VIRPEFIRHTGPRTVFDTSKKARVSAYKGSSESGMKYISFFDNVKLEIFTQMNLLYVLFVLLSYPGWHGLVVE
jgi:hypothetical protein